MDNNMTRQEEENRATVKELLEDLSDTEISILCISALRTWRRKHPTEVSVHGALGLEVVPLLLARKKRPPVNSDTLSGLKEPFITSAATSSWRRSVSTTSTVRTALVPSSRPPCRRPVHYRLLGALILVTAAACNSAPVNSVAESMVMCPWEGCDLLPRPVICSGTQTDCVDFVAQKVGRWSSCDTWVGGIVPTRDTAGLTLDVVIPDGIKVTYDMAMDASQRIDTIRLGGTLEFEATTTTRLFVDTLVSEPGGVLQIGTAGVPIASGKRAEIIIPNGGFADDDTRQMGKGLILNGLVRLYGAWKAPFTTISNGNDLKQGSDRIHLDVDPAWGSGPAWTIGDEIVISPSKFKTVCEAERFRILGFASDGAILLADSDKTPLSPTSLKWDHTPYRGQKVHVANLTRNVIVRAVSTSLSPPRRGHIMITRGKAQVHNVELRQMGRTNKAEFLADGDDWMAGSNQRGRYPLHFHRTLESISAPERSYVTGAVVNGSPGWGFVNHSSDVEVRDSVSYDVVGAGFVTEASDERGAFIHNIAICGDGDPDFNRYAPRKFEVNGKFDDADDDDPDSHNRVLHGDLAFSGDGFWVQSPLVQVTDNVATGMQGHAFILWNHGLFEPDRGTVVGPRVTDVQTLPSSDNGFRYSTYDTSRAMASDNPAKEFRGNVAYASFIGFMVRFNNHPNHQVFDGIMVKDASGTEYPFMDYVAGCAGNYNPGTALQSIVSWNNFYGLGLSYALNLTIDSAQVLTDQTDLDALAQTLGLEPWAINADSNLDDSLSQCLGTIESTTQFRDITIEGYDRAIDFSTDCEMNPHYYICSSNNSSWIIDHSDDVYCPGKTIYTDNGSCPP
jgi:hypothetical protein